MSLLTLSDEIIVKILNYISVNDLLSSSKTCRKLFNIASDHSLWKYVHAENLDNCKLMQLSQFLNDETTHLMISGISREELDSNFIPTLNER
jgi:hypothetical protein